VWNTCHFEKALDRAVLAKGTMKHRKQNVEGYGSIAARVRLVLKPCQSFEFRVANQTDVTFTYRRDVIRKTANCFGRKPFGRFRRRKPISMFSDSNRYNAVLIPID